jgi:hypothetical protein
LAPEDPAASISESDAAPFVAILIAQDLQASPPAEHAAILQYANQTKTHADAWKYMKEVQQKLAARRGSPATTEVSNKPRRPA